MQIDWTLISCLVIAFFAWSGFARGWWKEGITTVFLAAFIFLLQRPDWAQWLIDNLNDFIEAIWLILPDSINSFIADVLETFFGIDTGGAAFQLDASNPGTWVIALILILGLSILIGRLSFANRPTLVGAILGALIGGVNGFLVLNLVREYLDGRALPGQTTATAPFSAAGGISVGAAAQSVTVQATNLPDFTVLDSVFPWVLIGLGILLIVAILSTKVALRTNKAGGRKSDFRAVPPFYKATPKPKKPRTVEEIVDALTAK
jgi:hypothetical protein